MTSPDATRKGTHRRTILLALGAVGLVLIASAVWVGVRAVLLKAELEAMLPLASQLEDAANSRDLDRLGQVVTELGSHTAQADALSGDPVWRVAELTPWIGPNLAAARVVSSHLHAITVAADPLISVLESSSADGAAFDVEHLTALAGPLRRTSDALTAADSALTDIDTRQLIAPLASGVDRLTGAVGVAAAPLEQIAPAAEALPTVLGADGPRNILVMLQNNAELRTAGGISGSFALLRADNGSVSLVDQADSSDFPGQTEPVAPVPASTTELYGDRVGRFVQNATMPSSFPVTAELVTAWWSTRSDVSPDAVISLDMPAVAAMLHAAGPVVLPDGTELNSDNVVQKLLVDAYLELDRDQQTALQQQLTATLFATVLSGGVDTFALVDALVQPIADGRIAIWSADPADEKRFAASAFAGQSVRHADAGPGAFAVYFNDATAGKMGPFLDVAMTVGRADCRPDGLSDGVVTVALTNTAAPDAGTALPWWVTGGGIEGVEPGDIRMSVSVAAPPGAFFDGVTVGGENVLSTDVTDEGFPTSATTISMRPGETKEVTFRFVVDLGRDVAPSLLHTPLLTPADVEVVSPACR